MSIKLMNEAFDRMFELTDTSNNTHNKKKLVEITELPSSAIPKKVGKAYKVFRVKNGKLYPPMVANVGGEDTPIGVWLEAEEGEFAGLSKTGRKQVKSIGSGTLSYRPGWHLGDLPRAAQFDRTNKETGEKEFPKDFVWAECEYAMDVDYQPESDEQGYMRMDKEGREYRSDKYQHSLAGLTKIPKGGFYKYRTNPRPDTVPWVITGAIKVVKLLDDFEVNRILEKNGVEPIHRQGGDKTLDEIMSASMSKRNVQRKTESLELAIKRVLSRLNEAEMSDEDRRDSNILRNIAAKQRVRKNAALTKEEKDILKKYDLSASGGDIYSKSVYPYTRSSVVSKADRDNPNINYADKARKVPQRFERDAIYNDEGDLLGLVGNDNRHNARYMNNYTVSMNPLERYGWNKYNYDKTRQRAEDSRVNLPTQTRLHDMAMAVDDRNRANNKLASLQSEKDRKVADAKARYERDIEQADKDFTRDSAHYSGSAARNQSTIDRLLKRKKQESLRVRKLESVRRNNRNTYQKLLEEFIGNYVPYRNRGYANSEKVYVAKASEQRRLFNDITKILKMSGFEPYDRTIDNPMSVIKNMDPRAPFDGTTALIQFNNGGYSIVFYGLMDESDVVLDGNDRFAVVIEKLSGSEEYLPSDVRDKIRLAAEKYGWYYTEFKY